MQLSQIHGPSEQDEKTPGPVLSPDRRVGFAVVGLGRLSLNQIVPAFGRSDYSRVTALVSGNREKARHIAAQYGVPETSIYNYAEYERLTGNKNVQAIHIVLPNGLHEECVLRGAKTGKHILCEKPMATSSAEARRSLSAETISKVNRPTVDVTGETCIIT